MKEERERKKQKMRRTFHWVNVLQVVNTSHTGSFTLYRRWWETLWQKSGQLFSGQLHMQVVQQRRLFFFPWLLFLKGLNFNKYFPLQLRVNISYSCLSVVPFWPLGYRDVWINQNILFQLLLAVLAFSSLLMCVQCLKEKKKQRFYFYNVKKTQTNHQK